MRLYRWSIPYTWPSQKSFKEIQTHAFDKKIRKDIHFKDQSAEKVIVLKVLNFVGIKFRNFRDS